MNKTNTRVENKAFTLLEILVVVSIFAALGILITRSVILTLGGGKKSESIVSVRENLDYSLAVIERQLRNANSITDCTNTDTSKISYTDQNGTLTDFSCNNIGGSSSVGYVASGSSTLSGNNVDITSCSFVCELGDSFPSSVTVSLSGKNDSAVGTENTIISATTKVSLRNY
jgi:prepilin-type N-terminal cleavage/methylation domain-containing protein